MANPINNQEFIAANGFVPTGQPDLDAWLVQKIQKFNRHEETKEEVARAASWAKRNIRAYPVIKHVHEEAGMRIGPNHVDQQYQEAMRREEIMRDDRPHNRFIDSVKHAFAKIFRR